MIEFIFVSVMCIGQSCDFMVSAQPIAYDQCQVLKKEFLTLPFKPEVTLAAAQCMRIDTGEKV
jgi:hypothetical protein